MEKMDGMQNESSRDTQCCRNDCCGNGQGCSACGKFANLCWIHKIFKFLIGLLIILALLKFIFGGGMGWHRGDYGMGCMGASGPEMMRGDDDNFKKGGMMQRWFGDKDEYRQAGPAGISGTAGVDVAP